VSSSSQVIFGQPVWSPIDLLDRFLDDDPSDATRFGVRSLDHEFLPPLRAVDRPQQVWFISTAFIIAQVRENPSFCEDCLHRRS